MAKYALATKKKSGDDAISFSYVFDLTPVEQT